MWGSLPLQWVIWWVLQVVDIKPSKWLTPKLHFSLVRTKLDCDIYDCLLFGIGPRTRSPALKIATMASSHYQVANKTAQGKKAKERAWWGVSQNSHSEYILSASLKSQTSGLWYVLEAIAMTANSAKRMELSGWNEEKTMHK